MRFLSFLPPAAFTAFALLSLPLGAKGAGLEVRDPHYYRILAPHSQMRCAHMRDKSYGLIVERGSGDEIRITLLNNGKAEGAETSWVGSIRKEDHTGAQVARYSREGQYGRHFELVIGKRRSSEYAYGLPAMLTVMTELWSKDGEGKEKKDLYLDGNFRLSCQAPVSSLTAP